MGTIVLASYRYQFPACHFLEVNVKCGVIFIPGNGVTMN